MMHEQLVPHGAAWGHSGPAHHHIATGRPAGRRAELRPTVASDYGPQGPPPSRMRRIEGAEPTRAAIPPEGSGGAKAPIAGRCRFQCRFPGCEKLYASRDAVRKHCRKRHLDWLRHLDELAVCERNLPKPSLYCRWGEINLVTAGEEGERSAVAVRNF